MGVAQQAKKVLEMLDSVVVVMRMQFGTLVHVLSLVIYGWCGRSPRARGQDSVVPCRRKGQDTHCDGRDPWQLDR